MIKFKHIGDALLLTPVVVGIKRHYPEAEIWAWVRDGTQGILHGCEGLHTVLTSAPSGRNGRTGRLRQLSADIATIQHLRKQRFDLAFDFSEGARGRWALLASGAKFQAVSSTDEIAPVWGHLFDVCLPFSGMHDHRVVKDYLLVKNVLGLPDDPPPLQFSRERADFSFVQERDLDSCVVVHPCTRWQRKSWNPEHWSRLCRELAAKGERVVLSSGPDAQEIELCEQIQSGSGEQLVLTKGTLSWAGMAGLLYSAKMFVGVDTAAMHLSAACQTPIVALFGPTLEHAWRPWSCPHELVLPDRALSAVHTPGFVDDPRLRRMDDIRYEDVLRACERFLKAPN